jgi:hypothetical protein
MTVDLAFLTIAEAAALIKGLACPQLCARARQRLPFSGELLTPLEKRQPHYT